MNETALDEFVERGPFPIIIFNHQARVSDGQSCKSRAIRIPNIHLSYAGFIIGWDTLWNVGLKDWILIKCI